MKKTLTYIFILALVIILFSTFATGVSAADTYHYCPYCGVEFQGEYNYCPSCGKSLVAQGTTQASTQSAEEICPTNTSNKQPDAKRYIGFSCILLGFVSCFGAGIYQKYKEDANAGQFFILAGVILGMAGSVFVLLSIMGGK